MRPQHARSLTQQSSMLERGARLLVNDEEATQRDALLTEHAVLDADLALKVADQRVVEVAHAALLPVCTMPWTRQTGPCSRQDNWIISQWGHGVKNTETCRMLQNDVPVLLPTVMVRRGAVTMTFLAA